MKKLFYLLFLLPLAFFAACDDDDNLPQVNMTVTMSNVSKMGNTFYAIEGDTVKIDNTTVSSLSNKAATVTGVRYWLGPLRIISNPIVTPFEAAFVAEGLPVDENLGISVTATVLQVDKSISYAAMNIPFVVVKTLPDGAPELGTFSATATMGQSTTNPDAAKGVKTK